MKKNYLFLSIQFLFASLLYSYCNEEIECLQCTPLVSKCNSCSGNFFAEGSLLYWHPKVYGTEFASQYLFIDKIFKPEDESDEIDEIPIEIQATTKGCIQSVDLHWDWGFTAGIGYRLPYYNWDIFLRYTGLDAKGCKSIYTDEKNKYLTNYKNFLYNISNRKLGVFFSFISNFVSKKAKSNVYINLHTLQLDLGNPFYSCESIVLYPRVGLEFFWLTLQQNTRYSSVKPLFNLLLESDNNPDIQELLKLINTLPWDYSIKDRNKFSAIAPCFSCEAQWNFYENFYLYGNVCGKLFYGLFTICHTEKMNVFSIDEKSLNDIQLNPVVLNNRMRQYLHAFVPSVDTQIGLAYNTSINCDKINVTVKLAFDARYFWRINQILQANQSTISYERTSEDISMHGVTFDIRVDF